MNIPSRVTQPLFLALGALYLGTVSGPSCAAADEFSELDLELKKMVFEAELMLNKSAPTSIHGLGRVAYSFRGAINQYLDAKLNHQQELSGDQAHTINTAFDLLERFDTLQRKMIGHY